MTLSQECVSKYLPCVSNKLYQRIENMIIFAICICKQNLYFMFNTPDIRTLHILQHCLTNRGYFCTLLNISLTSKLLTFPLPVLERKRCQGISFRLQTGRLGCWLCLTHWSVTVMAWVISGLVEGPIAVPTPPCGAKAGPQLLGKQIWLEACKLLFSSPGVLQL